MLRQRFVTALILGPSAVALVLFGGERLFGFVVALLLSIAAWEWGGISGRPTIRQRIALTSLIGGGCLLLWWIRPDRSFLEMLVLVGATYWVLVVALLPLYRQGDKKEGRWQWLLLLAAFPELLSAWSAYVLLHALSPAWVVFVLMLCVVADTGAYFAGKRFGRSKLAPELSPGKTREGLLGGLAAVLLLAIIAAVWSGLDMLGGVYLALLSLVTALVSVTGDLFVSLLKREAGVKDTGRILPGHGGLLDRIDSHLAATPIFALGIQWWLQ